jgi:transposase, IS5 family
VANRGDSQAAPKVQDTSNRRVKTKQGVDQNEKRKNRTKSRVKSKVEWPFRIRILKCVFGYTKVRYRGIVMNRHWHPSAFALVKLYQHRKRMIPQLTPLRP